MPQNNFVIDVNIYISYILKGKLDQLFLFVLERDFEVFISKDLIYELRAVLQRKKFEKYLKMPIAKFTEAIQQFGNEVEPNKTKVQSPDAKDDYLF
ncbi:MAG: putative toxin-antitoxin system toxin component, PIN family [Ginsengibacter sp.]